MIPSLWTSSRSGAASRASEGTRRASASPPCDMPRAVSSRFRMRPGWIGTIAVFRSDRPRRSEDRRLRCVLHVDDQALAEGGERGLELIEPRVVVEVQEAADLARIAAEALGERGLGQAQVMHRLINGELGPGHGRKNGTSLAPLWTRWLSSPSEIR
jgi:hypothetical protein